MPGNHGLVCARAARHEFADAFQRAIRDYRGARLHAATCSKFLCSRLPDALPLAPLSFLYDEEVAQFAWEGSVVQSNAGAQEASLSLPFRVMARTRPLRPQELEAREYESVSNEGKNNAVVIHDGRVHRDGRTLYTVHSRFCLDRIFGLNEDNRTVYETSAKPLMKAASEGRRATLLFFGQTGTGKTYTARGVLDMLSDDVFRQVRSVSLLCYELAGTRGGRDACFDLLAEKASLKILTGEDGEVHVRGAKAVQCSSAEELRASLELAFSWRQSESTERNEASSRSHAVLELQFPSEISEGNETAGILRIVDLAGSERNFETQNHTRKMAERGGSINYSLLMLKECARIMLRNRQHREAGRPEQHVPFRASRLTHLLQSCFTDEAHRTVVVATLSPSPTDVEHSLNTLQHVGMMRDRRSLQTSTKTEAITRSEDGGLSNFAKVEGRGSALHSKLQDNRASQLKLHAFSVVGSVGGSLQKKYEPEKEMKEAFIDPRWHRELNVEVDGTDLWVLREADAEAVQILSAWRAEQWEARKAHDLARWNAATLQSFLRTLDLPGEAKIPTTMTGAMLRKLGRRGLSNLCSDEATAAILYEALQGEKVANEEWVVSHRDSIAKMTALGNRKVHAALPQSPSAAVATITEQPQDQEQA